MFNNDGVKKSSYGAPVQILANVEHQYSVGCRVPKTMGVSVGDRLIVKAGTPVFINLANLQTPVVAPAAATDDDPAVVANCVLLHNVDVTGVPAGGSKNGTALLWGFVNVNRLDTDVKSKVTAGTKIGDVQILNV
jgi:hypothetical protein